MDARETLIAAVVAVSLAGCAAGTAHVATKTDPAEYPCVWDGSRWMDGSSPCVWDGDEWEQPGDDVHKVRKSTKATKRK